MKILTGSDFHGKISTFENFSNILKNSDCDIGIIAGDILDDGIPDHEMEEIYNNTILTPDDFLEELRDPETNYEDFLQDKVNELHSDSHPWNIALLYKRDKVLNILSKSKKPIFIVTGNHDIVPWPSRNNVTNINGKKIQYNDVNFVGCSMITTEADSSENIKEVEKIERVITNETILVTHCPPLGILDGIKTHFGSSKILNLVNNKSPLHHIFGHSHACFGFINNRYYNVSYPASKSFFYLDTKNSDYRIIRENTLFKL